MDDPTAFERQLRDEVQRAFVPARPVDVSNIVRSAATQSPTWRFQSMFSAAKFAVAGAIVALVGGFLLAAVFTQQPSDEPPPPAAASASASPDTDDLDQSIRSDLLPGVDLVVKEVEPGVFRVVSDGVRERLLPWWDHGARLSVGLDGSVLVQVDFRQHAFRLGQEETIPVGEERSTLADGKVRTLVYDIYGVGPQGTVWARSTTKKAGNSDLRSWDGSRWVPRSERHRTHGSPPGVVVAADGTVYSVWEDVEADQAASGRVDETDRSLGRLSDDGWVVLLGPEDGGVGWLIGDATGELILVGVGDQVMRVTGDDLTPFLEATDVPDGMGAPEGVSRDGTVWWADWSGLARLDKTGWATFELPEFARAGADCWGGEVAAPDGAIWVNSAGCQGGPNGGTGLYRFDGQTWTTFLPDHAVGSLDLGRDGTVWVDAARMVGGFAVNDTAGLYVITPEAVAGREQ